MMIKTRQILITFLLIIIANTMKAQDTTHLSLLFLGDIMQHGSQISDAYEAKTKAYDYNPCFQFVKPYTQEADLAIGNLELTLAGPPYSGYPQFSAPDELLLALKGMGMDVLVTANNHCVDTGKKGLERTIDMLDSLNIPHTGTFKNVKDKTKNHPLFVERNGFKLALLNYTFSTNGLPVTSPNIVNMIDTASIRKDIVKAESQKPDAIIVFTHWGVEYQSLPSKSQRDVTEFCFKHGAKLVIGAHPHVIQPMEWRKDKDQLVTYSLGNFVSGQRKRYTDGGSMIKVELEKVFNNEGTSTTSIDTAQYILEWVYRTADHEKNYFILPVPSFENDSTGFIKDAASKEAFKVFMQDSRSLLKKHNVNIGESTNIPADTLVTYRVLYLKDVELVKEKLYAPVPYGSDPVKDEQGNLVYYSGIFTNQAEADKYCRKLRESLHYENAVVVRFKNGNPQ